MPVQAGQLRGDGARAAQYRIDVRLREGGRRSRWVKGMVGMTRQQQHVSHWNEDSDPPRC